LDQESLNIIHQLLTQFHTRIDRLPQILRRHAKSFARNLHETSIGRTHCAEHHGYAYEAQAADHGHFDRAIPGRAGEERSDTPLDEMNVFERPIAFLKNLPSPQRDTLQVWPEMIECLGRH
jgi:hypothetical protein